MTREEIISGLKFTVEMFLFDPSTGEKYTEPRNDMDKTTIDACKGAIELLKQEPILDNKIRAEIELHRRKTASIDPYDLVGDCLDIIDKYRTESEVQNANNN